MKLGRKIQVEQTMRLLGAVKDDQTFSRIVREAVRESGIEVLSNEELGFCIRHDDYGIRETAGRLKEELEKIA